MRVRISKCKTGEKVQAFNLSTCKAETERPWLEAGTPYLTTGAVLSPNT